MWKEGEGRERERIILPRRCQFTSVCRPVSSSVLHFHSVSAMSSSQQAADLLNIHVLYILFCIFSCVSVSCR